MKGTVALIIMICFCVCIKTNAQTVTLTGKNLDIEKVFREIRKQTGYNFIYNVAWLHQMKPVSLTLDHVTLTDALNKIFVDEPFTYTIIDKTIALKEKPIAQKKNDDLNTPERTYGHVTDSLGNPLAGASVLVKGSNRGITTDASGAFEFTGLSENSILLISYTGYNNKQVRIKNNQPLTVSLNKTVSPLDEIQVIAYGSTTKRFNVGDQTTITSKVIEQQPVENPLLALEGRVPGMEISQSNGLPGTAVKVQIRGQNSISNGNYPLYVIDGVPYPAKNLPSLGFYMLGSGNTTPAGSFDAGSPMSYIDPSDIESIEILKDADATAIYGSQGANGVVLINTKKGKAGTTKVLINIQDGFGKVPEHMKLLSTPQYLEMRNEAFKNDGAVPNPNVDYDLTLWDTTRQTDWQKELIGGTAEFTDVHASVSGGSANTQFLIGAGYNKTSTVYPADFNDQKASVNFNISNLSPNQKFRVQLSGIFSADNNHLPAYDLTLQALQLAPDAPPMYNPDGSINWAENSNGVSTWPGYNPAAALLSSLNIKTDNLVSNAVLSYQLAPGLIIKSSFGYNMIGANEYLGAPLTFFPPNIRPNQVRRSNFGNNNIETWIIEPQLSYSRKISKGILSVLIGSTIQETNSRAESIEATGFNSDLVMQDPGAATTIGASIASTVYKYNALFGRVNYNWDEKYILNFTARRDGSSRFGPGNQFHNFGALGLGWIFTKNEFISQKLPFVNFGKLRASYGTTGSDQVGDYTFMDLYTPVSYQVPYLGGSGYTATRIFSPDLSWEENKKLEGGIELGFFGERIFFSASYYLNRSSDQLVPRILPAVTGFTSVSENLPATVQNTGWEFELKTENIKTKNFRWTSSFNLSMNRNLLLAGAPGLSQYYLDKIGHPLSASQVYHFTGVNTFTGLYQFASAQGGSTSSPTAADQTYWIDQTTRFFGGLSNTITYKGFQLDFLFQFARPLFYDYLYNSIPGSFSFSFGGNQPATILDRWQQPGDIKPIQRFSQNGSTNSTQSNAASVSDQRAHLGYYIRLKNVSLSWQLPVEWTRTMHIQYMQAFVHAQNVFTITNFQGLDPESAAAGGLSVLPPLRVISFGIQMGL